MNRTIRQAMKEMVHKTLINFRSEPDKDLAQIEHYAESFIRDFERYLGAYHDFKDLKKED